MTQNAIKNDKVDDVVDGEILEDNKVAIINPADELKNIENLINSNIEKIDRIQGDIKPAQEMIESLLDADLEYAELDQKAKEAAKAKTMKKKELVNTTNGRELNEKIKTLKSELKEAKEALSSYLTSYQQQTGFNEYEGPDGELRQIIFVAKLVRKTKLNRD